MEFDNASNNVYSNEQVTPGNTGFERDVILLPTHDHLYAHTAQQVPCPLPSSSPSSPAIANMRDASASVAGFITARNAYVCMAVLL